MVQFLRKDASFSKDLSVGALAFTTSYPAKPRRIQRVTFTASQAITETITITLDSALGAAYDVILRTMNLAAQKNYIYNAPPETDLQPGDQLLIACTQANGVGTISGAVKARELN